MQKRVLSMLLYPFPEILMVQSYKTKALQLAIIDYRHCFYTALHKRRKEGKE